MDVNRPENSNTEYVTRDELENNKPIFESDESVNPYHYGPEGLGGWLILVGFGRVLAPFLLSRTILNTYLPIVASGELDKLSQPGNIGYSSLWRPTILFELCGNSIFLIFGIVLLILFFCRKKSFPKVFIAFSIITVLFAVADSALASQLQSSVSIDLKMNDPSQLVQSVVPALIWIPYMLKSVRVKNTFVR